MFKFDGHYQEDNFVRTRYYKNCERCNGKGEYKCRPLYYTSAYIKCTYCKGSGTVFLCERVMTRVNQPFPLATD